MTLIRALLGMIWYVFLTVLTVQFFVGILLVPGNLPENLQVLQWPLALLKLAASLLSYPVDLVLGLVMGYAPAAAQHWFPLSPAGELVDWLVTTIIGLIDPIAHALLLPALSSTAFGKQALAADYQTLLPGTFNWALLISISFWSYVEQLLLKPLNLLQGGIVHQKRDNWRAETMQHYRDIDKTG